MKSALLGTLLASSAFAFEGFPPSLVLDNQVEVNVPTVSHRNFDQFTFSDHGKPVKKRGHATRGYLKFVPEGSSHPTEQCWKAWEPLLLKNGWTLMSREGGAISLKRLDGKVETWLAFTLGDYQEPLINIIVVDGGPTELKLEPPAAKIAPVPDTADFPFLGHFPGSTFSGTVTVDAPFIAPATGPESEPVAVADGYVIKRYTPPATLSQFETLQSYSKALIKAGWYVLPFEEDGNSLMAHYVKNGRNVWATVGRGADDSDTGLGFSVADVGANDLAKALDKDCKVILRGVTFDFNKASLKPDSNTVLEAAAAALKSRPKLKLEVQGHTDNVGDDGYNEKLSQSRAESVRAWFTSHGIPAAQLTAKGFGKRVPVADNDSDEGRAKNRRVELACQK